MDGRDFAVKRETIHRKFEGMIKQNNNFKKFADFWKFSLDT